MRKVLAAAALAFLLVGGFGAALAATVVHVEIPFGGTASTVVTGTCTVAGKGTRSCEFSRQVAIPYTGTAVTDATVPDPTTAPTTTAPTTTSAPPATVTITSPADGATVSGRIAFTATVSTVPARVEFTIDGGMLSTEFESPYVYGGDGNTLDTTTLANGTHALAARAVLTDGSSVQAGATVNVQNSAPPPPPSGRSSLRGPILFRYGASYGAAQTTAGQGYDRYGVVVVGYGDDAKVAQLPTAKGLAYRLMAEAHPCANDQDCLSGISQQTADAAGCSLRTSSGAYLARGTYHLFDVGSAACQQRWADNVAARLAAKGLDGLFIDNLICDFADELSDNGPGSSAKYPTKAAQRAAVVSFAQAVSSQLQARGYYVLANTFCYGDSSAASNTAWWVDVAPYPNGLITESFEQNPSNYSELKYDCPSCSWMGDWRARLDVLDAAQAAGADAWELSSGGSLAAAKYACASFLLRWNGKGGGCGADTGGADPYDASGWAFPVGAPTGAMVQSGTAFYRLFAAGKAIVNPDPSSSAIVAGVGLAPKSAYVGP